jgi:hypothetical protein
MEPLERISKPTVKLSLDVMGHIARGRARPGRSLSLLVAALMLSVVSGCVALDGFVWKTDEPPAGKVGKIGVFWESQVAFAPDFLHNGQRTPGLGGRLYLFSPDGKYPIAGDGKVTVELYLPGKPAKADASTGEDVPDQPLDRWEFDPVTLKRLLQKDSLGWGYTLVMPWATYRPDIKDVKLRVCYQPPKDFPLYTESRLTLRPNTH